MADFYRGTTPTIQLNVGTDLREASALWLTVEDDYGREVMLLKPSLTVTETTVSGVLTQAQTLALSAGKVRIQLRAKLASSAAATEIMSAELGDVLTEGEIGVG